MATLTIRNVDDTTHARLRSRAASHGTSVEAEVRAILRAEVGAPGRNLLLELRHRLDGEGAAPEIPPRTDLAREVELP